MRPRHPLGLWMLVALCAAAAAPLGSAGCKSDYCSLGKLGPPFLGDISTGGPALQASLACSAAPNTKIQSPSPRQLLV